jgi:hypothetical protein
MKKLVIILILIFTGGLFTISDAQRTGSMMGGSMMADSSHGTTMQYGRRHQGVMNGNMMGNGYGYGMGNMMGHMGYGMNGMMNSTGYGNMMLSAGLLSESIWIVNRAPEMQQQLSLTDDQVTRLIDLQTSEVKQIVDLKADLSKKQMKLKRLIDANSSSKDVGAQLTVCATSSADIGLSYYETANKMKAVLNDSQERSLDQKWENNINSMRSTITK